MKTVYCYHAETGEYLHSELAEESPLEPGIYLLPAYATEVEPPAIAANAAAVFVDEQWQLVADYRNTIFYSTADGSEVQLSLGEQPDAAVCTVERPSAIHSWVNDAWVVDHSLLLAARWQELAAHRYAVETGGITLGNGVMMQTDRASQSMLAAAFSLLKEGFQSAVDYKTGSGFVQLNLQQISAIAQAVGQHVQQCFSREKAVYELLAAMSTEQLQQVSVAYLWNAH